MPPRRVAGGAFRAPAAAAMAPLLRLLLAAAVATLVEVNASGAAPDAAALLQAGDAAFARGEFSSAARAYTEALDAAGAAAQPLFYTKRAAAHMSLRQHSAALRDLDAAVAADAEFTQGYLHRGKLHRRAPPRRSHGGGCMARAHMAAAWHARRAAARSCMGRGMRPASATAWALHGRLRYSFAAHVAVRAAPRMRARCAHAARAWRHASPPSLTAPPTAPRRQAALQHRGGARGPGSGRPPEAGPQGGGKGAGAPAAAGRRAGVAG